MIAIIRLLLGIILSLSIVFAGASPLLAEIIRGEVKAAAAEAQVLTLRTNDDKLVLVSWDNKTAVSNLKNPAAIKPDDYLIIDFSLHGEQLLARMITVPLITLPTGIGAASFAQIDRFNDNTATDHPLTLIDIRPASKYDSGHIPGASSIPLTRITKRTAGLLPADKSATLVFYDDGAEAADVIKAAELTGKRGYTRVLIFTEGVRGWVKSGRFLAVSPAFIRKSKPALIDLRQPDKVNEGHIEGAVNYPLAELPQMYGNLPTSRHAPIVVYGENYREALAGAAIIRGWGYKSVTFFRGGVNAWTERAEALESGPAASQINSEAVAHSGNLSPKDFEMAAISPQTVELLDVRSDADYRRGHLPSGVHIPLKDLALRYKELSRDKIQVVFAADAGRAEMAYDFLRSKGYRINFLGASVEIDKNGNYTVK